MKKYYFIALLFALFACKDNQKKVAEKDDNLVTVPGEDPEMNNAIQVAKKTYPAFLQQFRDPDSSVSDFSVKMRFDYGEGNGEHMWLSNLYSRDEKLFGVLGDDPVKITTVHAGDSLEIKEDRLSDWMYIKGNKLVGGYTIKAIYRKMSEKEKAEFKQGFPFEID
jgi:uncharacterized protein YegJ (DUF2314 family)